MDTMDTWPIEAASDGSFGLYVLTRLVPAKKCMHGVGVTNVVNSRRRPCRSGDPRLSKESVKHLTEASA